MIIDSNFNKNGSIRAGGTRRDLGTINFSRVDTEFKTNSMSYISYVHSQEN